MGIQLHFIVFILLLISLRHSSDKFFFFKTMVTLITVFFHKSGSNFVNLIRQNPSICESDIFDHNQTHENIECDHFFRGQINVI